MTGLDLYLDGDHGESGAVSGGRVWRRSGEDKDREGSGEAQGKLKR